VSRSDGQRPVALNTWSVTGIECNPSKTPLLFHTIRVRLQFLQGSENEK